MFITVVTDHISERLPRVLRLGMVQAPLEKHQGETDDGKSLVGRLLRLDTKVCQAQMLLHIEIVDLHGPALWIDAQHWRCGQGEVRAQNDAGALGTIGTASGYRAGDST